MLKIPVNFGFQEIDENSYYGSGSYERSFIAPALNEVEIDKAVEILNNAERPVIYAGYGGVKAGEVITELSRKIKAPIITTGKNFEAFEWNYEGLTGSAYRVGWKPATKLSLKQTQFFSLVQTSHLLKFTKHSRTLKNSSSGYRSLQTW